MDEESATPTALMKIFGDFDTRVKTASRRTGDAFEGFRPSGSLLSSNIKLDEGSLLGRKASSSSLRGRLVFEDQDSPHSQAKRQKRTSGAVDDPLDGLDRYPKAKRTDDTKSSTAEIGNENVYYNSFYFSYFETMDLNFDILLCFVMFYNFPFFLRTNEDATHSKGR